MKRLTFVAALLVGQQVLLAAPRWTRISLPAEGADSGILITWNTDSVNDQSEVRYGKTQGALSAVAQGSAFQGKGGFGAIHEVTLTGLEADTVYYYSVGPTGDSSPVYSFRTAPVNPCVPARFTALGDHRSDDDHGPSPKWTSILEEATEQNPAFILDSGDLVNDGDDNQQWVNLLQVDAASSPSVAIMPCIGNHDDDNVEGADANYNQAYTLPTTAAGQPEDYYYFVFNHVLVVALSTQTFKSNGFQQQAQWLEQVLEAHQDTLWKFVFYHHPSYTSYIDLGGLGDLGHPPNEVGQNAVFVPLFDKYHVDIVFAGHNHFYERFAPMKGGQPQSDPSQGTIYVTSGGAGAFAYSSIEVFGLEINPMDVVCGDGILGFSGKADGSVVCYGNHHFVDVLIEYNQLTATVHATAAQLLGTDASNKKVIDTFTITKQVPNPQFCSEPQPDIAEEPDVAVAEPDTAVVDTGEAPRPEPAPDTAQEDTQPSPDTTPTQDSAPPPPQDTGTTVADPTHETQTNATSDGGGCATAGVRTTGNAVGMLLLLAVALLLYIGRRTRQLGWER